jgi:hypothetical protein
MERKNLKGKSKENMERSEPTLTCEGCGRDLTDKARTYLYCRDEKTKYSTRTILCSDRCLRIELERLGPE